MNFLLYFVQSDLGMFHPAKQKAVCVWNVLLTSDAGDMNRKPKGLWTRVWVEVGGRGRGRRHRERERERPLLLSFSERYKYIITLFNSNIFRGLRWKRFYKLDTSLLTKPGVNHNKWTTSSGPKAIPLKRHADVLGLCSLWTSFVPLCYSPFTGADM